MKPHRLISTTLCTAAMTAPTGVMAADTLALNHVWSRLADVNGEFGSVESAEFSPDSTRIATGTKFDNTVRVFRVSDGAEIWSRTVPQEIERVAWTADGRHVASVSEDGLLRVFDAESAEVVFRFQHENGIDGLTVSHDGRWLATGQERVDGVGLTRIFATEDWSLAQTLPHRGTVNELDFSSDDRWIAAAGDHTARIYDTRRWRIAHEFTLPADTETYGDKNIYINTRFNPDNSLLAVGGAFGFVYIYNTDKGELIRRIHKSAEKTETVEWTKDGRYLLVAGNGMTIDFFAVEHILDRAIDNGSLPVAMQVPVTDALEYMHFNETGALLTTAHQDGTVQLWTFMSDDPNVNERQHRKVRRAQDAAARAEGRYVE